jgi:CRP-like cAMP-binding protein
MDLKLLLQNSPAFGLLPAPQIEALAQSLKTGIFPQGHIFCAQGQPGDAMYILTDGRVRITEVDELAHLPRDSKDLHSGEAFALLAMVEDLPSPSTCTALTMVEAAVLTRESFEALRATAPSVARQVQYMIAVQLARDLQNRNKSLRALLEREVTIAITQARRKPA